MNKQVVNKRRKRGTGSLLARSGRWCMRWREGDRVREEMTRFRVDVKADRARAEELLSERTKLNALKERRDQLAILIAEYEDINARIKRLEAMAQTPAEPSARLAELVERWRTSPRRRDCSAVMLERYAAQLEAFVAWAGRETAISAVDDAVAERYAAYLAGHYSGNTYNKHLNTLTATWRAVGRAAGAEGNPWADLPRKRLETHVRRSLSEAETEKLLQAAEGEIRNLIAIGLFTGLRLGDACRMTWGAFGRDGTVRVRTSKTGAAVAIPAHPRLVEILGKRGRADDLVSPGMAATYERDDSRVSKLIRRTFEAAGIEASERRDGWSQARPTASFHSLRHTFVSRAVEAGVAPAIVQALVGHSSAAMTEHYTHVSAETMTEAFRRLG